MHSTGTRSMQRRKKHDPPVLKRHSRGGAYCYLGRRQKWFGPYDDPETHKRFAHFLQAWEANGRQAPPEPANGASAVSCETLVALYLAFCETHYRRPDGKPTGEAQQVAYTAKPLLDLYRRLPAESFSVHCLKQVRQAMVASGLSRKTVNQRIWRIRRMFRWAAEEELVPAEILASLSVLRSLQQGRTEAPEREAVTAVSEEHFRAVLPFLRTPVRAMVELQWWTGARPGEVREFRACYLSQSGPVWLYEPPQHKTSHRNNVVCKVTLTTLHLTRTGPNTSLATRIQADSGASRWCLETPSPRRGWTTAGPRSERLRRTERSPR